MKTDLLPFERAPFLFFLLSFREDLEENASCEGKLGARVRQVRGGRSLSRHPFLLFAGRRSGNEARGEKRVNNARSAAETEARKQNACSPRRPDVPVINCFASVLHS